MKSASGSSRFVLPALCFLFFFSGACALVYQVLWLRTLGWVFGVTVYAASAVWATFMAGLAVGSETMAFPLSALRTVRVVNERLGGVPVVVVHQPSAETTTAFEAEVKGKTLRFQAANADATSVIDLETHSTWDAYGLCVKGPLKGTQLKQLILIPEFWFAWSQFRPGTRLFTGGKNTP